MRTPGRNAGGLSVFACLRSVKLNLVGGTAGAPWGGGPGAYAGLGAGEYEARLAKEASRRPATSAKRPAGPPSADRPPGACRPEAEGEMTGHRPAGGRPSLPASLTCTSGRPG